MSLTKKQLKHIREKFDELMYSNGFEFREDEYRETFDYIRYKDDVPQSIVACYHNDKKYLGYNQFDVYYEASHIVSASNMGGQVMFKFIDDMDEALDPIYEYFKMQLIPFMDECITKFIVRNYMHTEAYKNKEKYRSMWLSRFKEYPSSMDSLCESFIVVYDEIDRSELKQKEELFIMLIVIYYKYLLEKYTMYEERYIVNTPPNGYTRYYILQEKVDESELPTAVSISRIYYSYQTRRNENLFYWRNRYYLDENVVKTSGYAGKNERVFY